MAETKLKGEPVRLAGSLVQVGDVFPDFCAVDSTLRARDLSEFRGQYVILNVFPSVDTAVCAQSVRFFNQEAISLENTTVINLSLDLPFAFKRFMEKEGLTHILSLSLFRDPAVGKQIGLRIENGILQGLLARAVFVLDPSGRVIHRELVEDISQPPRYHRAIEAIQ